MMILARLEPEVTDCAAIREGSSRSVASTLAGGAVCLSQRLEVPESPDIRLNDQPLALAVSLGNARVVLSARHMLVRTDTNRSRWFDGINMSGLEDAIQLASLRAGVSREEVENARTEFYVHLPSGNPCATSLAAQNPPG